MNSISPCNLAFCYYILKHVINLSFVKMYSTHETNVSFMETVSLSARNPLMVGKMEQPMFS